VGAPPSVTEALRAAPVLLLGAAGVSEVDLTPISYKEAALVGSIDHTVDGASAPGVAGPDRHSVDRALDVLGTGLLPYDVVVTHEFGLDEYRLAVETAIDRHGASKWSSRPSPGPGSLPSTTIACTKVRAAVKIAPPMDDLQGVGDPVTTQHLANSMFGALLAVVHQTAGDAGVDRVLERAGEHRSAADLRRPDGWSTHQQGLALFRAAADVLGDPGVGRKAGMEVFRQYAGTEVLALLRSIGSPGEMLRAYPAISAKQSTITRAEVVEVLETHGLISVVTPDHTRDPLFCDYTLGALSQFPVLFGMEPADVEELECQTRGDARCLVQVGWDPTSSVEASLEREVVVLREQVHVLTKRFESLESVAKELASTRDVNSMLETITRRAGVAVRAPRYLLVAQLPGDAAPRIHHVGFSDRGAEEAAHDVLHSDPDSRDPWRLVVDIESTRGHFGRLAAFYPENYHFLPQERSLLMAYAGHAAAALESAAALDESRDRNTTLSALLALGKALAEMSTRTEVAQRLADAMPEIAGADEAHVLLWDPGDALLTRAASTAVPGAEGAHRGPTALGNPGVANRLLEIATPTLVSAGSDPVLSSILTLTGLDSGVVVPITARNTLFGALVVGATGHELSVADALWDRLGGVAGLALLDEIRHQALHDPVTDLANSRLFEDRVTQSLTVARRNRTRLALLFVDLDWFKFVNDTHGHKVGDELLRAVAERLLETVREQDTVARIGGDEFGILLRDVSGPDGAETVAAKIVSTLGAPFTIRGSNLSIGASVGVTLFPEQTDTYDAVVSRADSAMYQAKADGRGRFKTYAPTSEFRLRRAQT
jgi:diguanylate cyclase (GGDEF)-like protein